MAVRQFVTGVVWGVLTAVVMTSVFVLLDWLSWLPPELPKAFADLGWRFEAIDFENMSLEIAGAFDWVYQNLGWSLIPFGLTLALFVHTIRQLQQQLANGARLSVISQRDHMADVWIGVFFGIGVIWTAVGMRSALMQALGDPSQAAEDGALSILSALVEGGILLALSTTIVGGIGGYLMRVYKAWVVGETLRQFYADISREQSHQVTAKLAAIEHHLSQLHRHQVNASPADKVILVKEAGVKEAEVKETGVKEVSR